VRVSYNFITSPCLRRNSVISGLPFQAACIRGVIPCESSSSTLTPSTYTINYWPEIQVFNSLWKKSSVWSEVLDLMLLPMTRILFSWAWGPSCICLKRWPKNEGTKQSSNNIIQPSILRYALHRRGEWDTIERRAQGQGHVQETREFPTLVKVGLPKNPPQNLIMKIPGTGTGTPYLGVQRNQ
jgi:hypothetical protein